MSIINQLSPGITVTEVDLTTIVPGVSTSTGAFVGQFSWGPVHVPTMITTGTELFNTFRNPQDNQLNSLLGSSFFSCANFLSYSGSLYVVREVGANATNAIAANIYYQYVSSSSITANSIASLANSNNVLYFANNSVTQNVTTGMAIFGNSVSYSTISTIVRNGATVSMNVATPFTANLVSGATYKFYNQVTGTTVQIKNKEQFENSYQNADLSFKYGPFVAKYPGVLGNSLGVSVCSSKTEFAFWTYKSYFDGAPDTSDYAGTKGSSSDEMHVVVIDTKGKWSGVAGTVLEKFAYLSKSLDAVGVDGRVSYYQDYLARYSNYIYAVDSVDYENTNTTWGELCQDVPVFYSAPNRTYTLSGGSNGSALVVGDLTQGWDLFSNKDLYDVSLLITGAAADVGGAAEVSQYVIDNIATVRGDCIAFISPRYNDVVNNAGGELAGIQNFVSTLNRSSSYVVADSGWKYQYDPYNKSYRWVPLNADVAGLCARTDLTNDAWVSPAGFNRGSVKNVIKLAWNPNQSFRDEIYKIGINPVISYSGQGVVLFGDKTLQSKPSAFDRINVRRLFIVLEKAISSASKYTLFEFNDPFTRAQFVAMVEPYLREVQGRRGIQDFKVVCDESNNTPDIIDRNGFVADIYIKPARSINYIQLNFIATKSGVDFNTIIGQF